MIDTHSHLLPSIDDGSASLEESLEMAREAALHGITDVICTPHLRSADDASAAHAPGALGRFQTDLAAAGIPLHLHLGFELTFSFLAEMQGQDLTPYVMGSQGRYLLVEVPHSGWPAFARDLLFDLRVRGFLPVLAHPERNDRIQHDPGLLPSLLALGAVAQGTLPSLAGHFGRSSRRTLLAMLSAGQISLLATDAHHYRGDTWTFRQAVALRGWEMAGPVLTDENPALLLRGAPLLPGPLLPVQGGAFGSLRRFFR